MAIKIMWQNWTKKTLNLTTFGNDLAQEGQVEQAPEETLPSDGSTTFETTDPSIAGTAGISAMAIWTEPITGARFGISVDYPLSIASVHLGDYSWGYMVDPAPPGIPSGFQKRTSSDLWQDGFATPVDIENIAGQFYYTIEPDFTADLLSFTITIGVKSTDPSADSYVPSAV
ncbi:hypothetical protein [Nitrospirillum pindoramense]|uniref:hypothetical protein n=1 Tax=Nitrospirillum amazonense TaxID=28077 RepID=UPI00119ECF1F|nr:hypothetical protein [Nitrospirillum amazonense]